MSNTQSGTILIGVAILMNVVGRLLLTATRISTSPALAGLLVVLMGASLVVGLFGLVRLIAGLARGSAGPRA